VSVIQFVCPPLPHYLNSGEDTYSPGRSHKNRQNLGRFDLLVVTRGCLYMGEEEEQWEVRGGEFLVLRPDKYHYGAEPCREETHFYWVHFDSKGGWSEPVDGVVTSAGIGAGTFAANVPRYGALSEPEEVYSLIQTIRAMVIQPSYQWKQQLLFQQLLLLLEKGQRSDRSYVAARVAERAAAYLRQHYRRAVAYEELGKALHFHPTYIARCMKQVFGCTPLEYMTRYRNDQAQLLLLNTEMTIGQIAEETGFVTLSSFSRSFSRQFGMNPRKYRKLH
jgi:AraC-like DNA-binding protein